MSEAEYHEALENAEKKTTVLYKSRLCEMNIVPYNTAILQLLKSNMNVQFVTGIYVMLTYLTSYLCKPEHTMSELIKKASKESYWRNVWEKLSANGNVFVIKCEVSTHDAIKLLSYLSLLLRTSNIGVSYIANAQKQLNQNVEKFTGIRNYGS